ncbi:MAG: photosynthetic reaction center cytochrome c subunit family protein [Acidobacteria bacterium]|nr:photosynthetic reaction center cytochrome c subunit family protein [Acidobacteriota bacterium]
MTAYRTTRDRRDASGRRLAGGAIALAAMCLLGVGFVAIDEVTAQAPVQPMAEEVYLDVQVLKGIPVDTFNDTMGMFASALLLDCVGCHVQEINFDTAAFATPTPRIQRARQMVIMMNAMNQTYFGGEQRITCFTCHNGDYQPAAAPSLRVQYADLVDDPSPLRFFFAIGAPPAEEIFARYIEAIGGAEAVGRITSVVATGTYAGFDTLDREVPLEIYAQSPNRRTLVAHWGGDDDLIWAFDGTNGWRVQPTAPAPLIELTGGNLVGASIDAMVSFPAQLSQAFDEFQVGYSEVDGQEVEVVRGIKAGQRPVNLYFDESGTLIRLVRWTETGAGPVPVQTDYSDYRDVEGVQMPFHQVITWTNGRSVIDLTEMRANVAIDDASFGRPELPAAP